MITIDELDNKISNIESSLKSESYWTERTYYLQQWNIYCTIEYGSQIHNFRESKIGEVDIFYDGDVQYRTHI